MQLGAIPVYLSDNHLLPWSDEIDWNTFSVVIKPEEFQNIMKMTLGRSATDVRKMQEVLSNIWDKHFSISATSHHILKRVK
jgi:hypothetical protein